MPPLTIEPETATAPAPVPLEEPTAAALKYFQTTTGEAATHLVYAPGRVNLIGEHTDYNGGFVLPLAIELGVYIAARPRADFLVRLWSAQQPGKPGECDLRETLAPAEPSWCNYVWGVVAGMQAAGVPVRGFDAVVHASLPAGGGLSSSAALEVAAATLLEALAGTRLDPEQKALLCQRAEHEFAGTPCGIMDQFAVTFGQRGNLLLIDCQSRARRLVPLPNADVSLLVINTMVKHALTDGGYASRRRDCHEAARLLGVGELREATLEQLISADPPLPERLERRARHVISENARTLAAVEALPAGAWSELGELMYASHASLRDDFDVSCAELDAVVDAARDLGAAAGVHGCRMTGGGFGGCCVALVEASRAAEVSQELHDRYLAATGLVPVIFATRPADGPTVLLQP